MGRLTTHVLDTAHGRPAAGMRLRLLSHDELDTRLLVETETNADGRTSAPLLEGAAFTPGRYELVFEVAAYFRGRGLVLPDPPFLDDVPIRFALSEVGLHYHVPLLCSPWSYATYRGS